MIQVLKLGLSGSETTLPDDSRINNRGADTPFFNESRSANKTLKTDFITLKQNWNITWDVLSDDNYTIVNDIVKLQYTNGTFLSFIYTDQDGTETTTTVRATITDKGTLSQCTEYYSNGVTLQLEQV